MLDHLSEGRFEFGTGRGAGSHEILGFLPGIDRPSRRPARSGRTSSASSRRCGCRTSTRATRASSGRCRRARSCPSRGRSRTRRCGTPPATPRATRWPRARASACSASRSATSTTWSRSSRPTRTAIANAEPIGAFVNDNIMVTTRGVRGRGRRDGVAVGARLRARTTCRATCSATTTRSRTPTGARTGPSSSPTRRPRRSTAWSSIGAVICGDPDEALEQCQRWESAGRRPARVRHRHAPPRGSTLETIRLIGEHVIPKIDTDPVHRTTRFREAGRPDSSA